jgi:hypothetical protein
MSEQDFNDAFNAAERAAEAKFPGYKGPTWGKFTQGKEALVLPYRTQVGFSDGSVYWLDVPHASILGGDQVMIAERERPLTATSSGLTMPPEYFETKNAIPHRFGTFVQLIRKAGHNVKGTDREEYR